MAASVFSNDGCASRHSAASPHRSELQHDCAQASTCATLLWVVELQSPWPHPLKIKSALKLPGAKGPKEHDSQAVAIQCSTWHLQVVPHAEALVGQHAACPPCKTAVQVTCLGGHEQQVQPCCSAQPFSCHRPCGRPLACGRHQCSKPCHSAAGASLLRHAHILTRPGRPASGAVQRCAVRLVHCRLAQGRRNSAAGAGSERASSAASEPSRLSAC